jgi:hypothetical protein
MASNNNVTILEAEEVIQSAADFVDGAIPYEISNHYYARHFVHY